MSEWLILLWEGESKVGTKIPGKSDVDIYISLPTKVGKLKRLINGEKIIIASEPLAWLIFCNAFVNISSPACRRDTVHSQDWSDMAMESLTDFRSNLLWQNWTIKTRKKSTDIDIRQSKASFVVWVFLDCGQCLIHVTSLFHWIEILL